ncbi:class I SAM-dependent DNA methyltransferase [Virgibacillus kimchii]
MGREFLHIFDGWADTYDASVAGHDEQYSKVFENYEKILRAVVEQANPGTILEFGVGTGNLTEKLLRAEYHVIGIEPSEAMRKVAGEKLPELTLYEGDFLDYPEFEIDVNTIVSTFAFHHLTDSEKEVAIKKFAGLLTQKGKVVFGDTMFTSDLHRMTVIKEAKENGHFDLAVDLDREYYPNIDLLRNIFTSHGFDVTFRQMNYFAWLVVATKK